MHTSPTVALEPITKSQLGSAPTDESPHSNTPLSGTLRYASLGSGSSGNASVISIGDEATKHACLLVDAGLAMRQLEERLVRKGLNWDSLGAVFITHEHSDHAGCVQQLAKEMPHLPLWMSAGTHQALGAIAWPQLRVLRDGESAWLGEMRVVPFTVPHDSREPLQLRIWHGSLSLALLTDLGHVSAHVLASIQGANALILEFNHDAQQLKNGPYPQFLKERVGGDWGHLSNVQAMDALAKSLHPDLSWVLAGHLSEKNNCPDTVLQCLAETLHQQKQHLRDASATTTSPIKYSLADIQGSASWLEVRTRFAEAAM